MGDDWGREKEKVCTCESLVVSFVSRRDRTLRNIFTGIYHVLKKKKGAQETGMLKVRQEKLSVIQGKME